MIDATSLMQLAINKAREGIAANQTPFGCAIADPDGGLTVAHNTVLATTDITAHAEMNAVRQACRRRGQIFLTDCIVATTCEPCPMCMAALHWARVKEVYYGATIADAEAAGFNELALPAAKLLQIGNSSVKLTAGVLPADCQRLFTEWQQNEGATSY